MKRIVIAVGLIMLLVAVSGTAQTPAPKPGPEHKKLEIWVGDWTFEEEGSATPFGPAYKINGKASVKPILGGFFVEWNADVKGPIATTKWFEIDGYDPVTKRYFWNWYGNDGGVQSCTYTIEGSKASYSGNRVLGEKQAKTRGTIVIAPDSMSWTSKEEISVDGKTWMPNFENKFTKAKSSPK